MELNYETSVTKRATYVDETTNNTYKIEANIAQNEGVATLTSLSVQVLKENGQYHGQIGLSDGRQTSSLPFDSDIMGHIAVFNSIIEDLKKPQTTKAK